MGITNLDGDFKPVEIRAYSSRKKKEYSDYAIIAVDAMQKIAALGKDAYKYIDSTDKTALNGFSVYSTMKRNVIADYTATECFIRWLLKGELQGLRLKLHKPSVVLCIPFELTQVERKAFEDAFYQAGSKKVTIVEKEYEYSKNELSQQYDIVVGVIANEYRN